jgi:hypothetical protein
MLDVKKSIEGRGIPKRELRPGFTQPGGGLDFSGLDRPISSVKEKPGGGCGSKYDAKRSAGRGKGKDFERMLRSRMSGY